MPHALFSSYTPTHLNRSHVLNFPASLPHLAPLSLALFLAGHGHEPQIQPSSIFAFSFPLGPLRQAVCIFAQFSTAKAK